MIPGTKFKKRLKTYDFKFIFRRFLSSKTKHLTYQTHALHDQVRDYYGECKATAAAAAEEAAKVQAAAAAEQKKVGCLYCRCRSYRCIGY